MDAKEKIIIKWLNGELSPNELEAFKKLDEYASYVKLSEKANTFRAPNFDIETSLRQLNQKKNTKKASNLNWYAYIAAAVIIFICTFAFIKTISSNSETTSFKTDVAVSQIITLPDNSEVNLSSNTNLTYVPKNWDENRSLQLDGEALFNVEKGEKFTVNTSRGNIEVLGTIFNVKSRAHAFSVSCFEGSVQVTVSNQIIVLKANDVLTLKNNQYTISKTKLTNPDWKENRTNIDSMPLEFVLEEFKNYYEVEFNTNNVDINQLYTGSFTHDNVEFALKSITLPLGLSYTINDKKIILSDQ